MKFGRSACLAGLVALGAWSVAACSSDNTSSNGDGGTPDGGGATPGSGGKGSGTGGSTSGSGGKGSGTGGSTSGTGGKGAGTGGSTTSVDGGNDGGVPEVKITSPKDLASIELAADKKIPIEFTVANFALMAPMTPVAQCPKGSCGHVHINVDLMACDAVGVPYNTAGISSPLDIDLSLCPAASIPGAHTVTISLHNTDHSDVDDSSGHLISDTITISVVTGDAGADAGKKDGG
jgi:hypothetical protein